MLPENGNGKVYVGIPRERIYLTQFVDNRDAILARIQFKGLASGYFQAEGHRVDRNRDRIVKEFLAQESKPEWLLMLDTDMEHPVDIAERLIRWQKPIVGGLYFHRGHSHDPFAFRNGPKLKDEYGRENRTWAPMRDEVYQWIMDANLPLRDGSVVIDGMDEKALIECDAVATGAILIHRTVLETMQMPIFEYWAGGYSEDLTFCADAKEKYGFPVYCDLSTISGHYSWVPMGQVQFRMQYENRGINLTSYTKRMAGKWYSDFFGISLDEALAMIEEGSGHVVGDLWQATFGDRKVSRVEEEAFYRSEETGQHYIMELLHWNFTGTYNQLRQMLTPLRQNDIINFGAGIGSEALQLIIQKNNVLAVEINPILRDFICLRYDDLKEMVETNLGKFSVVGEEWMEKVPDESFDGVVALDVLEHLPEKDLRLVIKHFGRALRQGGHLYYHANWGQQDLYPMHHNFSAVWLSILTENGFIPVSPVEAVKIKGASKP